MSVVANSLNDGNIRQTYLLYGEESYLRNYNKNLIKQKLVAEGDNLNFSYFEGASTNPDEVAGLVSTMPFLAQYRVIIVENSGWFASKGGSDAEESDSSDSEQQEKSSGKTENLVKAIKEMSEDVVLVFAEEKVDKRSKLYKAVTQKGISEEYKTPDEDSLARWVAGYAKNGGRGITKEAAYHLVEEAGRDMFLLSNEMDKLIAWTLDKGVIEAADVDAVSTHQVNNKIFDMITAIAAHRQKEALRLYYDLLTLRESPFHILALLVRQYTQMLEVRDLQLKNYSVANIAMKLDMKDWLVKKVLEVARNMSLPKIKACLEACAKADENIKNGNLTDTVSVELLIIECSM